MALCLSDQLLTFLDSDKPRLAASTGEKAEGARPNSTYRALV